MSTDERRAYARQVVFNPIHYHVNRPHHEVRSEWIESIVAMPYFQETDPRDCRELYYGWIDEISRWIKVVVEDDRLLTAYIDRRLTSRFGRLS